MTKYHGELLTLQLGGAVCDRPCPGHPAYRSDELRLAISVKDIKSTLSMCASNKTIRRQHNNSRSQVTSDPHYVHDNR